MFWFLYFLFVAVVIILWIVWAIRLIYLLLKLAFQIAWLCILVCFAAVLIVGKGCRWLYRLATRPKPKVDAGVWDIRWHNGQIEILPPQR